jgi:hypothetical protein
LGGKVITVVQSFVIVVLCVAEAVARDEPSTLVFQVNDGTDVSDAAPGDGDCATNDGVCTLRAALEEIDALDIERAEVHLEPEAIYLLTHSDDGSVTSEEGPSALRLLRATATLFGHGAVIEARFRKPGTFRLFLVGRDASLTISDTTLSGGLASALPMNDLAGAGGAFLNRGQLELADCVLRHNGTSDGFGGGALYNEGEAALARTILDTNTACCGYPTHGGAIFNTGNLRLVDSEIRDSTTAGSDFGGFGGAIFNSGTALVAGSRIEHNRTGGSCEGGDGGAIYSTGSLQVRDSIIARNSTRTGGYGGGVYSSGTATIDTSVVRENFIEMAFEEGDGGSGGGIFNRGEMSISRTTVSAN